MTYTSPTYISVADTAKLVRQELKAHFPTIKFSVRSKSYAGGASINIDYTDGPTSKAVEAVVKQFEGASFDGMIDLKSSVENTWKGEKVHFASDYVFVHRSLSVEFLTAVTRAYCTRYNQPMPVIAVSCGDAYILDRQYADTNHYTQNIMKKVYETDASKLGSLFEQEDKELAEYDARVAARKAQEEEASTHTIVSVIEEAGDTTRIRVLQPGQTTPFRMQITGDIRFSLKRYDAVLVDEAMFDAVLIARTA